MTKQHCTGQRATVQQTNMSKLDLRGKARQDHTQTCAADTLTDPQIVKPLAHGATLVWDLIEVLVETRLEWDESRQGREVVF